MKLIDTGITRMEALTVIEIQATLLVISGTALKGLLVLGWLPTVSHNKAVIPITLAGLMELIPISSMRERSDMSVFIRVKVAVTFPIQLR